MRSFSLAELMIVVAAIAVTAAAVGVRESRQNALDLAAAVTMGLAVAGPALLVWRLRRGALPQRLGLGELAWLGLGLYFVPLVAWNLVAPANRVPVRGWLLIAVVLSATMLFATLVLGLARGLVRLLGAPLSGGQSWFARRWTNLLGALLVLAYCALGMAAFLR